MRQQGTAEVKEGRRRLRGRQGSKWYVHVHTLFSTPDRSVPPPLVWANMAWGGVKKKNTNLGGQGGPQTFKDAGFG